MHTGWIWYRLEPLNINNLDWYFSFGLEHDRLKWIQFVFYKKSDKSSDSWDNWSEKEELENAKQFNAWLDKEIGTERDFSWGKVYAGYDQRAAFSRIDIQYKTSR